MLKFVKKTGENIDTDEHGNLSLDIRRYEQSLYTDIMKQIQGFEVNKLSP
jgi:hypothetical protein